MKVKIPDISPYIPSGPYIKRQKERDKKNERLAGQLAKQQHSYEPYLDKRKFQFTDSKPVGQGAMDLTSFGIGKTPRATTLNDVKKLNNKDFLTFKLV